MSVACAGWGANSPQNAGRPPGATQPALATGRVETGPAVQATERLQASGTKQAAAATPTLAATQAARATRQVVPAEATGQASATAQAAANGQRARQHLEALAGGIGPRLAGSRQEAQAAAYIQAALEADGYPVQVQPFTFEGEVEGQEVGGKSLNVIAVKPGRSAKEIVVGAHYDSVTAGKGADDNASGVAVLLEVAEKVSKVTTPYTLRFIAFGAEEVDLNGSRTYARRMSQAEIENTRGMINLDSLAAGDIAYVYGQAGTADSLRDWIVKTANEAGYALETRTAEELNNADGTPCDCSDYSPFEKLGIPFAYFEATNWNLGDQDGYTQVDPALGEDGEIWHTRYDTVEQIEALFPGRIDAHLELFVTLLYETLTRME